jgi:hypothetical protein
MGCLPNFSNVENHFATTHSHINYAVSHSAGDRIGCDDGTCEFGDIPRNKREDRICVTPSQRGVGYLGDGRRRVQRDEYYEYLH